MEMPWALGPASHILSDPVGSRPLKGTQCSLVGKAGCQTSHWASVGAHENTVTVVKQKEHVLGGRSHRQEFGVTHPGPALLPTLGA